MNNLKTLTKEFVQNKTVFYRSPYDISVKFQDGTHVVSDTSRIEVTLPTLKFLIDQNCKIVISTWVKRPEGYNESLSTLPIAKKLSEYLKINVLHANDSIGDEVKNQIRNLKPKEILLLENTRFYKEDYIEDLEFAKKLVEGCEVIVFDAFPQSHRAASSVTGILKVMPAVCGLYFAKEVSELNKLIQNPIHPFTLIIGGAKISDKIGAVNNLIKLCDKVIIGGAPAHIFLKARGISVADSLIEEYFADEISGNKYNANEIAKNLIATSSSKLKLPVDFMCVKSSEPNNEVSIKDISNNQSIPEGFKALDIGPKTLEFFKNEIKDSKTIFWNGPMGNIEDDRFTIGTNELAIGVANIQGLTIIAGGDTVGMISNLGISSRFSHLSVAGGAALEFLAGNKLPALELLKV